MIEELHAEDDPLLNLLQYLNPLILVFLRVVGIVYRHDDQTGRRDFIHVLEQALLDDLKERELLLLWLI
jgi:hypothetical protein